MRLRLQQLNVPLEYNDAEILFRAGRKLGCEVTALSDVVVVRRSLDARARNAEPMHVLTVELTCALPALPRSAPPATVEILGPPEPESPPLRIDWPAGKPRPVVVGAGPAGLMAAYQLAMAGARPVLLERGEPAAERTPKVAQFWNLGRLTTNGMSYSRRALAKGNAAFLVPVGPADYPEHSIPALAGVEFQRGLERAAFDAAGGDYRVPAVRLVDFLARRVSSDLPEDRSCPRSAPVEFRSILPEFATRTLEKALLPMLKELNRVKPEDAVLYAPETRSSSPLWVVRDAGGESVNTRGLYPVGEGAGYAGGIVSSAIDGMDVALRPFARRE